MAGARQDWLRTASARWDVKKQRMPPPSPSGSPLCLVPLPLLNRWPGYRPPNPRRGISPLHSSAALALAWQLRPSLCPAPAWLWGVAGTPGSPGSPGSHNKRTAPLSLFTGFGRSVPGYCRPPKTRSAAAAKINPCHRPLLDGRAHTAPQPLLRNLALYSTVEMRGPVNYYLKLQGILQSPCGRAHRLPRHDPAAERTVLLSAGHR